MTIIRGSQCPALEPAPCGYASLRKVVISLLANYIGEYVKGECQNSPLGKSLYENHFILVARYGLKLARKTGADPEIVELASYLHDFSVVLNIDTLQDHEIRGMEIAENLLTQFHYPKDKIEKVKICILNHSSPRRPNAASAEEVCVSNADLMSQIAKPDYWLQFYSSVINRFDGRIRFSNLINDNWPLLVDPAKEMMREQYEQARAKIESYVGG